MTDIEIPFARLELRLEQSPEPLDEQAEIDRLVELAKTIR